jgi:hypothetical protein
VGTGVGVGVGVAVPTGVGVAVATGVGVAVAVGVGVAVAAPLGVGVGFGCCGVRTTGEPLQAVSATIAIAPSIRETLRMSSPRRAMW